MELKEKAISLAEELGIDFGEVHRVIGVSASTLEAAFNGHKKPLTGKIKICDCCSSSLAEFSAYRWNEKSGNDAPIKENDHAMDDIRYFVNTVLYNKGGFFVDVR